MVTTATHGGPRPRAGRRPLPPAERKPQLTLTISPATLAILSEMRGDAETYGQLLDRIVRDYVGDGRD